MPINKSEKEFQVNEQFKLVLDYSVSYIRIFFNNKRISFIPRSVIESFSDIEKAFSEVCSIFKNWIKKDLDVHVLGKEISAQLMKDLGHDRVHKGDLLAKETYYNMIKTTLQQIDMDEFKTLLISGFFSYLSTEDLTIAASINSFLIKIIKDDPSFLEEFINEILYDNIFNEMPLSEELLLLLIKFKFEKYSKRIEEGEFSLSSIFQVDWNSFFYLKELIKSQQEGELEKFNYEVVKLLKLNQAPIILFLIAENIVEDLPSQEKNKLLSTFTQDLEKFISIFITADKECNSTFDPDYSDFFFDGFTNIGKVGFKFLVKLYILDGLYPYSDSDFHQHEIQWNIHQYFFYEMKNDKKRRLLREEISEYVSRSEYSEFIEFFSYSINHERVLLELLEKDDFSKIMSSPESNFIENLNKLIESGKRPCCSIRRIVKFLGPIGAELYLKLIRHVTEFSFELFEGMGKDIFEPFLRDVIINENHYKYEGETTLGESVLETLYQILFDSMTKEELTKFVCFTNSDNHDIVDQLIEAEYKRSNKPITGKRDPSHDILRFIYHLLYRLDYYIVRHIFDKLPNDLKDLTRDYYMMYIEDPIEIEINEEYGIEEKPESRRSKRILRIIDK